MAGLSPTTLAEWAAKARVGTANPVVWENPGAYVQMGRVPDAVLLALPPPKRPLWPVSPGYHTWRTLRSFSFALVFVALAAYLHIRARVRGTLRLEMERSTPWLARLLVGLGVLRGYEGLLSSEADREAVWRRVFGRFADPAPVGQPSASLAATQAPASGARSGWPGLFASPGPATAAVPATNDTSSSSSPTIPLARAVALLSIVRGEVEKGAVAGGAAAAAVVEAAAAPAVLLSRLQPSPALLAAAAAAPPSLTLEQFVPLALVATRELGATPLYLAVWECLGVAAVSPPSGAALADLFDGVVAVRESRDAFSPAALAGLCGDLGFLPDEGEAAAFLAECAGRAATPGAPSSAVVPLPAPAAPVRLTRAQFVDYLSGAAAAGEVDEARVCDYVKVFRLLHLSSVRASAGVPLL